MLKYYSALTQVIILGFVCFCCPGMFNALNSMGGAGQVDDNTGTNANVALYTTFAVFGLLGGGVNNLIGPRFTIFLGGLTYALYSGSFLYYNHTHQPVFSIVAGAILGIGAGLLWAAQGAVMMSYPTEDRKGAYIALFWVIFNLGGVLGGLIPFGLNFHGSAGPVNDGTYIGFLALEILGAILGLALAPPERVIREDGTNVELRKEPVFSEFLQVLKLFTNKWMLALTPAFFVSNFFYTYQFNVVNGALFNTRTRGFNSVFYWGSQMVGAFFLGKLLDNTRLTRKKRGAYGLFIAFGGFMAVWLGGLFLQLQFTRDTPETDKYNPHNTIDFTDSARAAGPIILYVCYGLMDAIFQTFCYWLMGTLTNDMTTLSRFSGYYKGVQSAGAAVAWRIDAVGTPFLTQLIVNWALLAVSLPVMFVVVWRIRDTSQHDLVHQNEKEDVSVSDKQGTPATP
ncbi:hypothetical protein H4R34_004099 [Dimargaris verticillata]|uniref:Major facilitator superfamily domain-containing protein n=1 Tax=Dimargaris verticillata TaxID=2761393 RepID=A0A9W8AYU6_9FUNG|nr:hypothetical protein H4R34_004099 [Dimargaris verticillata]